LCEIASGISECIFGGFGALVSIVKYQFLFSQGGGIMCPRAQLGENYFQGGLVRNLLSQQAPKYLDFRAVLITTRIRDVEIPK
jgi:hypothetical protein